MYKYSHFTTQVHPMSVAFSSSSSDISHCLSSFAQVPPKGSSKGFHYFVGPCLCYCRYETLVLNVSLPFPFQLAPDILVSVRFDSLSRPACRRTYPAPI